MIYRIIQVTKIRVRSCPEEACGLLAHNTKCSHYLFLIVFGLKQSICTQRIVSSLAQQLWHNALVDNTMDLCWGMLFSRELDFNFGKVPGGGILLLSGLKDRYGMFRFFGL